ncbi:MULTISPECIES: DUF2271 domain-containing protein [Halomonas]|uniref:Uncharacterized protein DUF2271 n=1 Tax=Halomonas ventosae TaxID=229007 RepID=A0A4R6I2T5_9GAMM|nr:DUF2271 domain-containing protein [Halomonas ventosae]TDO15288.1 uncharacterized protein DUF2271 [Halomonas ventosae]
MKSILAPLTLAAALSLPVIASAAPVTFTTQLNRYGGNGAYLAYYVTDASGAYVGSLWMAGEKSKYYKDLTGWYRATGGDTAQVDGITGASVGEGQTLEFTLDLNDALFEQGYTLHVDAAVEDRRQSPREINIPLNRANAGELVRGRRYIASFKYEM